MRAIAMNAATGLHRAVQRSRMDQSTGRRRRSGTFYALLIVLAALGGACSGAGSTDTTQQPPRTLYQDAQSLEDAGLYTEAIDKYKKVASENQGTRLGSFAYFRMAELYVKQEDWLQADTNYRLFLSANSNSHLNAYVLYRLLTVNDKKAYSGLFFREREIDRDMDPSKQIITEYKRFYLLYPSSIYAPDVIQIYRAARRTLAAHEIVVAYFYLRHGEYNAAAGRYLYVLRNYPELENPEYALRRLIEAYRHDQQPGPADEMQRIYDQFYGKKAEAVPSPATASGR